MGVRLSFFALCLGLVAVGCGSDHVTTPTPAACAAGVGTPISLAVGAYTTVDPATDSGCVRFAANASAIDSTEYLVVAQSAAGTPGQTSPFRLQGGAAAATAAALFATGAPVGRSQVAIDFDRHLRWMARSRAYPVLAANRAPTTAAGRQSVALAPDTTAPLVGNRRVFKVCGNLSCSTIKNVIARARVVGAHIAVYVDSLAPAPGIDSVSLDSLKQVFDTRLFPLDTAAFGAVSDIDTNHVVVVLMSNVVNSLVTKTQCHSSGFVAGFFFAGDLDPTFGPQFNNGEVFYTVVADPDSTLSCPHTAAQINFLTPVTFVHEFQHMISFVQHVLVRGGNTEEGWLDEGLSKYAEELAGRSYLPGNNQQFTNYVIGDLFDAYQYLHAPSASPLLIPEDTGSLAEIGASWLFTRYLVDQFGASLPRMLHQTTDVGSVNVANRTGQPFTTVVTRWALTNWVSDLPSFAAPAELQYSSWHFRTTFASLNSQDATDFPLPYPLVPGAGAGGQVSITGTLTSGSGAYVRVFQAPSGAAFSLHFTRDGSTALPAALVPRLDIIRIR
jgi:hypothetical protein